MTDEIKKAINRHIPTCWLIKAGVTMMFIFLFTYVATYFTAKAYELITPDRYRIDYSMWVDPLKDSFEKWEDLVFQSNNVRKRDIDVYWEDTPYYIMKDWAFQKGRTQKRPIEWTQRVGPNVKENIIAPRPYTLHIPIHAVQAKMCWYIIWYTPRFKFEKTDFYCTRRFWVNWHNVEEKF